MVLRIVASARQTGQVIFIIRMVVPSKHARQIESIWDRYLSVRCVTVATQVTSLFYKNKTRYHCCFYSGNGGNKHVSVTSVASQDFELVTATGRVNTDCYLCYQSYL